MTRISVTGQDNIGTQVSICDTGYFFLTEYSRQTAGDHMKHLYGSYLMPVEIRSSTTVDP
ncbi:MAG: hypothetical protein KAT41_06835 [Candidatus Marinimicrobia bacterium]|nr:hypothetical protein [Candidatus Neomarinimicrobiota bacterium]